MSMVIALVLLLAGCFAAEDGPSDPVDVLRSEVEFVEDEGLEGSVSIDSFDLVCLVLATARTLDNSGILRGSLRLCLAMSVKKPCGCATTCGFSDQEEFLIDAFNTVWATGTSSAPGKRARVEGDFLIRTDDPRDFEWLALMRLVARIKRPEE